MLDAESFRQSMRVVPSSVTVVTARSASEMRGITIGSFTSLTLDPPLVCFNLSRNSRMYHVLADAPGFAIHVLSGDQAHLSRHFAASDRTGEEQFKHVDFRHDTCGTPILEDAALVLYCRSHDELEIGGKLIIVGCVQWARVNAHSSVLVYHRHQYDKIGPQHEVASDPVHPRGLSSQVSGLPTNGSLESSST